MGKSNPYQVAQAALVLNHLVLDIGEIDAEALTRFCNDPQSKERAKVMKLFTVKTKDVVQEVSQTAKSVLKDMITAGKYDWVNSSITEENFPMPANFVLGLEPKVFHFGRYISSENAIKEMDAKGFRPATIFDLLDFGAKNPEEQRKYPIVALGSVAVISARRSVAYLDRYDSGRYLGLFFFGNGWSGCYRFLGVRK